MDLDEDVLFYAFRYVLGRKTYAVSMIATDIKEHWFELSDKFKDTIKEEIQKALDNDAAGMNIDKSSWKRILELK